MTTSDKQELNKKLARMSGYTGSKEDNEYLETMANAERCKKLAEWVGFKKPIPSIPLDKLDDLEQLIYDTSWIYPDGTNSLDYVARDNIESGLPNFTQSLDACFKWLVPKLFALRKGITLGYSTLIGEELNHWYVHILACDFTGKYIEGTDKKSLALALCLAIEKLIDGK